MQARKKGSQLLSYGLPFMAFMLMGWYGLASLVQSKRELRGASKGLGAYEELDPVERMRRRYGIGKEGAASSGPAAASPPRVSSLEEELEATLSNLDIKNFDYKPVPRPAEEEE